MTYHSVKNNNHEKTIGMVKYGSYIYKYKTTNENIISLQRLEFERKWCILPTKWKKSFPAGGWNKFTPFLNQRRNGKCANNLNNLCHSVSAVGHFNQWSYSVNYMGQNYLPATGSNKASHQPCPRSLYNCHNPFQNKSTRFKRKKKKNHSHTKNKKHSRWSQIISSVTLVKT